MKTNLYLPIFACTNSLLNFLLTLTTNSKCIEVYCCMHMQCFIKIQYNFASLVK